MAEWRVGKEDSFDVSMNNWYNFVQGNEVEFFSATPGMLLWYRNSRYNDNWVGEHPWAGQLLLVDAHPELILADVYYNSVARTRELPFRTRLQLADAAFGPFVTCFVPLPHAPSML